MLPEPSKASTRMASRIFVSSKFLPTPFDGRRFATSTMAAFGKASAGARIKRPISIALLAATGVLIPLPSPKESTGTGGGGRPSASA